VPSSATVLTGSGAFRDTTVRGKLNLPDVVSLSAVHELDRQWSLLGDATWTNWSRFKELRFEFGNPAQPTSVTPENW
jgi:long-chain fatty acid transport protein